jgi:hypothetical protein
MSVSAPSPTPQAPPPPRPPAPRAVVTLALLARAVLACALVLGSGAVRWWQARRVDAAMAQGREAPFPLAQVPINLGTWEGTATELDPLIVEGTGSSDHITRRYVDRRTGVSLDVIVLYGPTHDVFIHSPELCYPKAGFTGAGETIERPIRCPVGNVPFRSVAYTKGDAGRSDSQEVYYSWRYGGRWSTTATTPKQSERIPGMYKVQVARRIVRGESRTLDNPCESFLEVLIPDLEARITASARLPESAKPQPGHTRPDAPLEGNPR